jgi:hypothetical protein
MIYPSPPLSLRALASLHAGRRFARYLQTFETLSSSLCAFTLHTAADTFTSLECNCWITWTSRLARIQYNHIASDADYQLSPTAACSRRPTPPAVTASRYCVLISTTFRRQIIYSCGGTRP